jgi:hypothetical protein
VGAQDINGRRRARIRTAMGITLRVPEAVSRLGRRCALVQASADSQKMHTLVPHEKCNKCYVVFAGIKSRNRHHMAYHRSTLQDMFSCREHQKAMKGTDDWCGCVTTSMNYLRQHMDVVCHVCCDFCGIYTNSRVCLSLSLMIDLWMPF